MNISPSYAIPLLEYRCHKCNTYYSKEDIPIEPKRANAIFCPHCGSTFSIGYSGDSIVTIAA